MIPADARATFLRQLQAFTNSFMADMHGRNEPITPRETSRQSRAIQLLSDREAGIPIATWPDPDPPRFDNDSR